MKVNYLGMASVGNIALALFNFAHGQNGIGIFCLVVGVACWIFDLRKRP